MNLFKEIHGFASPPRDRFAFIGCNRLLKRTARYAGEPIKQCWQKFVKSLSLPTSTQKGTVRENMSPIWRGLNFATMMKSPYLADFVVDSAVGLLLIESGARKNSMTISCFSEVAHHPTTLWISVARTSYSYELLLEAGRFSLAALNLNQRSLALACGSISGREDDKCRTLDLYRSEEGFLFLRGALASTSCRVRQSIDIDDHTLFIADILTTDLDSRKAHLRHLLLSDLKDLS